jgi:signal transduction histidine kinase
MSTAHLILATRVGNDKPLPPPWDGDIDASSDAFRSAIRPLMNTEPELALAVCQEAFSQAERRADNDAAVHALLRMYAVLQNTSMNLALKNAVWTCVSERAEAVVDPVLSVRLATIKVVRLIESGENAHALACGQSALAEAMAIGDDLLIVGILKHLVVALFTLGEPDLALDLCHQITPLLPNGDSFAVGAQAGHARNLAMVWLGLAGVRESAGDASAGRSALESAHQQAELSCALALTLNNDQGKLNSLDTLVRILLTKGEVAAARAQVERFQAALDTSPSPGTELWVLLHLSLTQINIHEGRDLDGTLSTLLAIESAQQRNHQNNYDHRVVQSALAQIYERLGNYERALSYQIRIADSQSQADTAMTRERVKMMRHALLAMRTEAAEFITHDLRTPLAAARTWLHTLADDRLPAESQTALREAELQVRDAFDLSDLYLSVLRAEFLPASALQRLDLGALTDDLCENLSPPTTSSIGLTRDTEIGVDVIGHARLLTRALTALLNHAFSRAPTGTAVHVRVARVQVGPVSEVQVCVADRGGSLPLQTRMRLYQCHAPGTAEGVSPLGLVARVARLHQARIRIDSPPAGGSTVTLCFKPAR